jgi:pilus assembly protein Flp/PilA
MAIIKIVGTPGEVGTKGRKHMVLAYIRALDYLEGSLQGRLRRQEGQALVEYALIISLVAIFLITALTFMRGKLDTIFTNIGNALS